MKVFPSTDYCLEHTVVGYILLLQSKARWHMAPVISNTCYSKAYRRMVSFALVSDRGSNFLQRATLQTHSSSQVV